MAVISTFENELAVLASAFDGEGYTDIAPILSINDFTNPAFAECWKWMGELSEQRRPMDLWTLRQVYAERPHFPEVAKSLAEAPSVMHGSSVHYAEILRDRAAFRRMLISLNKATEAAQLADNYAEARIAIEAALSNITAERAGAELLPVHEIVDRVIENAKSGAKNVERFPTGFHRLDDMLSGGVGAGHLCIIAGGTGAGKSTFAVNVATNIAEKGVPVGIFALEMTGDETVMRMALSLAGRLKEVDACLSKVASLPMWITDNPDRTVENIRGMIRLMVLRYNIRVVVVDYLQLIAETDPKANRERQVAHISRNLKLAAKESNVTLIALSQLNDDGRLRESRAIENDSDSITYVVTRNDRFFLWLSKNRHGNKHGLASRIEDNLEKEGIELNFLKKDFRFQEKYHP